MALQLPIIDLVPLRQRTSRRAEVAAAIGTACRECGFFYVTGHGVDEALQQRLEELSRAFFAQEAAVKMELAMARGGRAWRGYFPVGGELTAGLPDQKEGLYFGAELGADHPRVRSQTPLHGANLFPPLPGFRETVLEYMAALTTLGHTVMRGIALSLGLAENYFTEHYTGDPLILFRIFNYPALSAATPHWGVGEHTDYGLLTLLKQDGAGGLQVKSGGQWIEAPPLAGSFVCNIGDMLERLTAGCYRSTPHRARNLSGRDRLSFPFFFDPNFDAEIAPLPLTPIPTGGAAERWDQASVHEFRGTYGDYLLGKVAKVFPQLCRAVL